MWYNRKDSKTVTWPGVRAKPASCCLGGGALNLNFPYTFAPHQGSMESQAIQWIWSAPHQQYYYTTYDGAIFSCSVFETLLTDSSGTGRIVHHWLSNAHVKTNTRISPTVYQPVQYRSVHEQVGSYEIQTQPRVRFDSGYEDDHYVEAVPSDIRSSLPNLISGTSGSAEPLDDSTSYIHFLYLSNIRSLLCAHWDGRAKILHSWKGNFPNGSEYHQS
jgi:hypothetical protein